MAGLKKTRIKEKKERKQIKKENRVAKNLLLLNPGNLAKEVYTYGYHFSWKTHLFVMYCRNGSDRLTVSTEMETACHCADRHVFGTSGIYP